MDREGRQARNARNGLEQQLAGIERDLAAERARRSQAEAALQAIHGSRMWRFYTSYVRLRQACRHPGTWLRRRAASLRRTAPAAVRGFFAKVGRLLGAGSRRVAGAAGAFYLLLVTTALRARARLHRRVTARSGPAAAPRKASTDPVSKERGPDVSTSGPRPRLLVVAPSPLGHDAAIDHLDLVRALGASVELHLFLFCGKTGDLMQRSVVEPHCAGVYFHPVDVSSRPDIWHLDPRTVLPFDSRALRIHLRDRILRHRIDRVLLLDADLLRFKTVFDPATVAVWEDGHRDSGDDERTDAPGFVERMRRLRRRVAAWNQADEIHVRSPAAGHQVAPYLRGGWSRVRVSADAEALRRRLAPTDRRTTDRASTGAPSSEAASQTPDVSVVMPTYNGGEILERCLEAVFAQKTDAAFEVICVDSDSNAPTLAVLRSFPVRLISIDRRTFNHGLTRDLGARNARGRVLVFLNQDAVPCDDFWLQRLTQPLLRPGRYAAIQGGIREIPDVSERFYWESCGQRFYFTHESVRWISHYGGIGFATGNAAIRRDVWRRFPFGWAPIMEDKKWQRDITEAGLAIGRQEQAAVYHTHNYGLRQLVRRCISEGFGWRFLGEPYRLTDALKDLAQPHVYADWWRGVSQRRIRTSAELLFPWLRPLLLYHGNRWSSDVKL